MSFGHALYYPHISLSNITWLKHAILYWDRLTRIVPEPVQPQDHDDIIRLCGETDFLSNHSPESYEVAQAFNGFGAYLRELIEHDDFYRHFARRFGPWPEEMMHEYAHRLRHDPQFRFRMFRSSARRTGTHIHVMKLDPELKEYLYRLGLAYPGRNEWEDWVEIDSEIGSLYMTYLAKSIANEKSLPIVTDTEESHAASLVFDPTLRRDRGAGIDFKLANLVIATVVPKDMNDVPMQRVIEIRSKHVAERMAFFEHIEQLCKNLPEIETENGLRDALNHHSQAMIHQVKEQKKLYTSFKIDTVTKFLSVSLPSALVSAVAQIPVEFKPVGVAVGLAFGIVSAAASVRKERIELSQHPLAYLLSIRRDLDAVGFLARLNDLVAHVRHR